MATPHLLLATLWQTANMRQEENSTLNPFVRLLGVFSALAAAFAAIIAFLNRITDLPVATQKSRWLLYFVPDALIIAAIITLISTLYFISDKAVFPSVWHSLRYGSTSGTVLLVALVLVVVLVLFPVADAVIDHYDARKFSARFDWHYAFARQAFQSRRCEQALTELRRQGPHLNYLNPIFRERMKSEEGELLRRLRDADTLIDRYQSSLDGGLTFYNALKVERAAVICHDCRSVRGVADDLRKKINIAIDEYVIGIEQLRGKDMNGAALHLKHSQKACSQLLHQKELLKYVSDPSSAHSDPETTALIAFYTNAPMQQIRQSILEYPPLKHMLRIGLD